MSVGRFAELIRATWLTTCTSTGRRSAGWRDVRGSEEYDSSAAHLERRDGPHGELGDAPRPSNERRARGLGHSHESAVDESHSCSDGAGYHEDAAARQAVERGTRESGAPALFSQ